MVGNVKLLVGMPTALVQTEIQGCKLIRSEKGFKDVHLRGSGVKFGNISTTTEWMAMSFCTDSLGPHIMDPNDFGDPLTFPLAPRVGQAFHSYSKIPFYLPTNTQN